MRSRAAHAGLLVIALLAAPVIAESQSPAKTFRVGMLSPLSAGSEAANEKAFRDTLRDLGYVGGQNAVIERRYADGQAERLPALAADLVRTRVDVILAWPTPAVRAAQQASTTVPIVIHPAATTAPRRPHHRVTSLGRSARRAKTSRESGRRQ